MMTPEQKIATKAAVTTLPRGGKATMDAAPAASRDANAISPEFSDDALALRFSEAHAGRLIYVPRWRRWLRWNGARWAEDDTLSVYDMVRTRCRAEASRSNSNGQAIASAQKVAAVERMARADPRHARTPDDFDTDPWLLNTPGGTVDLRTGRMRPHDPADMLTRTTRVAPSGDCPMWRRFLHEATGGDAEVIAYLRRWIGYCLTGSVREHAFAFLHGPGGNGKGVLLNTLAAMMGDYATTAMMGTFVASRGDRHPTELASLRGARLVTAQETEEGQAWAEARIKSLTGGDRVSAHFMHGDPFEFSPMFKLLISGNHRPPLRNPDQAMRRRMHLIPFLHRPTAPDPSLPEKLVAELPGILAWAVEGCLEWQRIGLAPPAAVMDATAEYFEAQDGIGQWLAERTEQRAGAAAGSSVLFHDWKQWAEHRNLPAGSQLRFSEAMQQRFTKRRLGREGVQFLGVALLPSDAGAW